MNANSRFELGTVSRAVVVSSLVALGSAGTVLGQEALDLKNLKIVLPPNEMPVATFEAEEDQQVLVFSTPDLQCWGFAGGCVEWNPGDYQFVDLRVGQDDRQFYVFAPPLPPQFEQLRAELGDEQFAEWLEQNVAETGSLSGVPEDRLDGLGEAERQAFDEQEGVLEQWLKDFKNESTPLLPELELPPLFEEVRIEWGDYDLAKLLVQNQDQWGNLHGICPPFIIEWQEQNPVIFVKFQTEEQVLQQWLEDYLVQLPPDLLAEFEPQEKPLPPNLEQLRLELGDENFAEWLSENRERFGNHQGINEGTLPDDPGFMEEFEAVEEALRCWLEEFDRNASR